MTTIAESIKDPKVLQQILWVDFLMGSGTVVLGWLFKSTLLLWLGLSEAIFDFICGASFAYALFVLVVLFKRPFSIPLLKALILANWIWTGTSLLIISSHFGQAAALGKIFLLLQVGIAALLAYFEGQQIQRSEG